MRGSYLVFPCFDRSWISPTRIELIVSLISNGCFEKGYGFGCYLCLLSSLSTGLMNLVFFLRASLIRDAIHYSLYVLGDVFLLFKI